MRKYKIALVTDKYLPIFGGLELFLHDLAIELARLGHDPHVICATPGDSDVGPFPVTRLDVPLLLYRARSTSAVEKLDAVLRAGGFDLVHAHCIFSPLAHAATYLAKRLNTPSVFTLHSVVRGASAVTMSLLDRVLHWSARPTVLTAVSNHVADQLQTLTRRPVELLLNAAHLDQWRVERREELRIVSAMRFTIRKRPVDLIRVIPSVLARLPRSLWPKFTLIGDGPERRAVEREIARLDVAAHVELPGALLRPEIAKLLARSAIFAVPCQHEALSIAAIEARAAGLPVVARIPSGVSEVVEHGVHGLLARDTPEFVDHLVALIRNPALRATMSSHASQNLDRFKWSRCIERHEEIYALACEQHARS